MLSLGVGLIALTGFLRLWLEMRQRGFLLRQRSASLPRWADATSMHRAITGALQRSIIAIAGIAAELAAALVFAIHGIETLERTQPLLSLAPAATAFAVASLIMMVMGGIRRVADVTNAFLVDARMGLGRPPALVFARDTLVRFLTSSIVNVPVLATAAVLMEAQIPAWWFSVWLLWVMLVVMDMALRPLIQSRLLYTSISLDPTAPIAESIDRLLRRCGLSLESVDVLDASRRTRRANASVHGLGRRKHIYLHDTLLERLGPGKILAVVAHEAGHSRCGHVWKFLSVLSALGLLGAFGLSILAAGLEGSSAHQLGMIVVVIPSVSFLVRPVLFGLSRRFEYEADAFAVSHVGSRPMIRALEQLYAANAGLPLADRLHASFHASHPMARDRLGRLCS